ncbi:hypothetical protein HK099_000413 [Clydaea vesicula]|uniref:4-alpha-glucanotransferase n=1 Tax=Clydaea vesicula TaxID=447962 RepID=A0AAD5U7U2_9FUNG|nr:hypothetical protein HK099_000413 [Clydaea vesicula]
MNLLPMDGINLLTVIPKWLPIIPKWESYFKSISETGYNMVHFAPLSTRGESNSPYAIFDQLALSDDLFDQHALKKVIAEAEKNKNSDSVVENNLLEAEKEKVLGDMLNIIWKKHGVVCCTDIVWNHTACNSDFLQDHPEAGYNLKNSPHLRSAYELDDKLLEFSEKLLDGVYGEPITELNSVGDVNHVMNKWIHECFPQLKLWEFYVINVEQSKLDFDDAWSCFEKGQCNDEILKERYRKLDLRNISSKDKATLILTNQKLCLINLKKTEFNNFKVGERYSKTIVHKNMCYFIKEVLNQTGMSYDSAKRVFEELLNEINLHFYMEFDFDVKIIQEQLMGRIMFLRVSDHGPKLGAITKDCPLVDTYFTRLPSNSRTSRLHSDEMMLANNGWLWNADPLINFAAEGSKAYLLRQVIVWGDCKSNPWLWDHMTKYTLKMARLFKGFRIDNCHSTPLHVASYLLDAARKVNPDLYVFAELFTGSEEKDVIFVKTLGIHSLIREAMNAGNSAEMSRLVHKYGGLPIGSFRYSIESFPLELLGHKVKNSKQLQNGKISNEKEKILFVPVEGSTPHAMFMDCTHDNETPHQKRTAKDTLPNAAIVAMTDCAIGSVKGYDEIVPELLNVVNETRKYRIPDKNEGIIPAKSIFSRVHTKMANEGYHEIHVHQENDFVVVHRVHPLNHDGYLLIARNAFNNEPNNYQLSPTILKNQSVRLLQSASLEVLPYTPVTKSRRASISSLVSSKGNGSLLSNGTELPSPLGSPQTDPVRSGSTFPYFALDQSFQYSDSSIKDDVLLPQSPNQLFHHMSFSHPPKKDVIDLAAIVEAKVASQRIRRKILGVITGMPCSLDFSTSSTSLVRVWEENAEYGGEVHTHIEVDMKEFVPGSIVMYRTWNNGSGCELNDDELFSASNDDTEDRESQSNSTRKGTLQELWKHLGILKEESALDWMVKLGLGSVDSMGLWFNEDKALWPPGLWEAVENLNDIELNAALFRVGEEELDFTDGVINTYNVPNYGHLSYCGLQGFVSAMLPAARNNDLGHPICSNIREGPWLIDYTLNRLLNYCGTFPNMQKFRNWLSERLCLVKKISVSLIPKYFTFVVFAAYQGLKYKAISSSLKNNSQFKKLNTELINNSKSANSTTSDLLNSLSLTEIQLSGIVKSTRLIPKKLAEELFSKSKNFNGEWGLAAGLTHFSTHHMRCWGRDVFIALRGIFVLLGKFEEAKAHIVAFGSVIKHGLIPNLLDQGVRPRYNARDAAWWWLYGVQQYCQAAPEGIEFLKFKVKRRYPPLKRYQSNTATYLKVDDDLTEEDLTVDLDNELCYYYTSTIGEICHEILERHFRGIKFREYNAGPNLDHAMNTEGFNINCGVLKDTGIVFGGNRYNCGTWMDKMGDSKKAGTYGLPATPRDGADVEIVGLCKSALNWITSILKERNWKDMFPCDEVVAKESGKEIKLKYSAWNDLLKKSFEDNFFIPLSSEKDVNYNVNTSLVNRRGIYRDCVGSTLEYADYQLRPNFCVAILVAPELFNYEHAVGALEIVKNNLLGPLGMKTLDPSDWGYRGVYDNANDSEDPSVAHGYNYHQGPEWVWIQFFFFRAYLNFEKNSNDKARIEKAKCWIRGVLKTYKQFLCDTHKNPYNGIPELTNQNGAFCRDSCASQAWSNSTMIELIHDLVNF